jgi:hypothetical protein
MSDTLLDFYAQHGLMSDPGAHADLFSNLPDDVPGLCKVVQGLLLHESPFWAEQYGYAIPPERAMESGIRDVAAKLGRVRELDERPLTEPRLYKHKLACTCRDFALLLTAMLRHKGVPARARFGFALYFELGWYGDHVVAEYWHADEQRWVLVDPQLDDLQCGVIGATFDPCDIPSDLFVCGGQAWQKCQNGEVDPERFGFGEFRGLWYVKGHLARDVAALNKVEMLCWDYWGIFVRGDTELAQDELALLDRAARLSLPQGHWDGVGGNMDFQELRALYVQDMRLRVPAVVKNWPVENEHDYELQDILGESPSLAKYL